MSISHLTTASFDAAVQGSNTPIVVDFWAEWCQPCKKIAPILEELDVELDGQVAFAKLNVDENPDVAMRYGVMSIPTLLVFQGGDVRKKMVGAKGKSAFLQDLSEFL